MFCSGLEPTALIQDLATLMSTSPKFPSSKILIDFGRFTKLADSEEELLPFFKLNGKLVKTLCLAGRLPKKELLDILNLLCPLLPNLECLDLSHVDKNWILRNCYEDFIPSSNSVMIPIPIKRLRLRSCFHFEKEYDKNVCELIKIIVNSTSTPNLKCIQNVDAATLKSIVEADKGHLVQELNLFCSLTLNVEVSPIERFAEVMLTTSPLLSVLHINLQDIHQFEGYPEMAFAISNLIDACSETLEHLTITDIDFTQLDTQIDILEMPELKYLHLTQNGVSYHSYSQNQNDFDEHHNQDKEEGYIFDFVEEDGMPKNEYFPRLQHLKLTNEKYNSWSSTLMKFFALNSNCDATVNLDGSRDLIPTVTTLEICDSPWPSVSKSELISKVFPNIRVLKIEHKHETQFQNSVWVLCPLAESIHIYNVSYEAEHYWDGNLIGSVDKFFTGFPLETCESLSNGEVPDEAPSSSQSQNDANNGLKVYPSVSDLKYLKELKIHFLEISGQFGSHVTSVHAIQKMPTTNFIFTYYPASPGLNAEKDFLLSLGPNVEVIYK